MSLFQESASTEEADNTDIEMNHVNQQGRGGNDAWEEKSSRGTTRNSGSGGYNQQPYDPETRPLRS